MAKFAGMFASKDEINPVKGIIKFNLCLGVCPLITFTVFCGLYMSMWIEALNTQSFYADKFETENKVVPDVPFYD